jgi:signal peptide peptidase SppA
MKTYDHVCEAFYSTPWAILPAKLNEIRAFLEFKAHGQAAPVPVSPRWELWEHMSAWDDRPSPPEARDRNGVQMSGRVAILPIIGVISQKMNLMTEISGGTSTDMTGQALDRLVADKSVRSIVLAVDSPGGSVFGVEELGRKIFAAKSEKKIVAVADSMAASAAYWIASQASEFAVTPGGMVGSIGVYMAHQDISKAEEAAGVKTTIIKAGKFKAEGDPSQPLDEEAKAALQEKADKYYGMFVDAVARGRGVTEARVRNGFGQGRMVMAKDAVAEGMADRVATLAQIVSRLGGEAGGGQGMAAEADEPLRLAAKLASYRARTVEVMEAV